ncbi:HipA domain-containing protein [Vibrio halioticoli]|uniref:HipA domain-containing protein n=1 Tax=Vibrio TaxID=662 RepID=UPI001F091F4F|nr:HipA domain-containing protein [Vibrio halioticoli]
MDPELHLYPGEHHVFLTKRFDRTADNRRIHFTSAMTQLQYFDGNDDGASYLELAEFLINYGSNTKSDLKQLWTRMLFNIMVSNSDDHLRNHGFLLTKGAGLFLLPMILIPLYMLLVYI